MNSDERDPLEITNPDDITSQLNAPDPIPGMPAPSPAPIIVVQPSGGGGGGGGRRRGAEKEKAPTKLQQTLPSAERVKVERRRVDGHKAFVGLYSLAEIKRYGSWEIFLQQVVIPKFGSGEFELTYVRADGNDEPNPRIIIMDEPPASEHSQTAPLDQVVRLAKQLQDDATRNAPAQVDPLQQMQQLLALQKQMGGDGGGMMQTMMLMQMMNRPEPKPDPMEATFRMVELMKTLQPPPQPLPPMPMPVGPDPTMTLVLEMMKMQSENTRAIVESIRHQDKGPGLAEILQLSQAMSPKDQIGARDILPMISTMKDLVRPPEKDTLADQLAAFKMMREEMKSLSDDQRPSGFREFAESVLPEGVESITKLIQAIRSKEGAQAAQLAQPLEGTQRMPQFPPGFPQYAQAITKSQDPVEAMGATITAFLYLGQSPDFRTSLETLVRHARGGEKDEALALLESFLEGIGRLGLITEQSANFAMEGFDKHWDDVVSHLLGGSAPPKPAPKPPTAKQPPRPRTVSVVGHPPVPITDAQVIPIQGQPIVTPPPSGDGSPPPTSVS
jgi:hypothetical protein